MADRTLLTLRGYFMFRLMDDGVPHFAAAEAIASTAIEHPEWDMDGERKTMQQWATDLGSNLPSKYRGRPVEDTNPL